MNAVTRRAIGPLTKKDDVPKEPSSCGTQPQGTKAPTCRAEPLHILLPDFDRAEAS